MPQTSVAIAVNSQDVSATPMKVNDASGVLAGRVLVAGTNADECKRPAAANAEGIAIAGHDADNGQDVSAYDFGYMNLVTASAIAVNDNVNIANVEGRVKAVSEAAGVVVHRVGKARSAATAAGQYVKVKLKFDRYTA
jgi:hypothetical protein